MYDIPAMDPAHGMDGIRHTSLLSGSPVFHPVRTLRSWITFSQLLSLKTWAVHLALDFIALRFSVEFMERLGLHWLLFIVDPHPRLLLALGKFSTLQAPSLSKNILGD